MGGSRAGRAAGHVWPDQVWPRLAGALVAVGMLSALDTFGADGIALMVLALTSLMSGMAYTVLVETDGVVRRAWQLGLICSISLVTVVGLMDLAPRIAWPVVIAVALTSPPVLRRAAALRIEATGRLAEHRDHRPAAAPVHRYQDPAQAAVDRAFDEIVRDFRGG